LSSVARWFCGSRLARRARRGDDAELGRQIPGAGREEDLACAALEGEPAAILARTSPTQRLGLARQVRARFMAGLATMPLS
jgi:hypothetical protein